MTEQKNERKLDEFDWERRHGVEFLQGVLWELGLDSEPEETLIEVLETVNDLTGLYVFDIETAKESLDLISQLNFEKNKSLQIARQKRINARHKRKLEAKDDEDFFCIGMTGAYDNLCTSTFGGHDNLPGF